MFAIQDDYKSFIIMWELLDIFMLKLSVVEKIYNN